MSDPYMFRVVYFDAKLSKKGQGRQVRHFTDRAEADAFAAQQRYAAKPAVVVEVPHPAPPVHSRISHAAHYDNHHPDVGHDLEWWDSMLPFYDAPKPRDVPANAERHSGYVDREGVQHVMFCRTAPLTGTCPRCEALKGVQ